MPHPPAPRSRNLGVLALAVIAPLWGYSWVVSKVALGYSGPLTFAGLISGLGAVCLFVVLAARRRPLRPPPLGWTLLIGLLQTALFNGLATAALVVGGAGKVSVLVYTMPFWLLLLAWLFLGERLRGVQWPAVALAFAGLILVVRPWDIGGALSGVLACAAGLSWAGAALAVKLLQRRTHTDTLSLTAWQLLFGCVPLLALGLLIEGVGAGLDPRLHRLPGVLGPARQRRVLGALALRAPRPAGRAPRGWARSPSPVVGVVAAWLQLGEKPTPVEAAGMALIIAGLAALAAVGVAAGRGGGPGGAEEPALLPIID